MGALQACQLCCVLEHLLLRMHTQDLDVAEVVCDRSPKHWEENGGINKFAFYCHGFRFPLVSNSHRKETLSFFRISVSEW